MATLVTSGALLQCTMGSAPSALDIPTTRGVSAGGRAVATVTDQLSGTNIRPFGQCRSPANPAVAALPPGASAPCAPAIVSPWTPGSSTVKAGNLPAVHNGCQCICRWGGTVTIVSPGQQTTTVG